MKSTIEGLVDLAVTKIDELTSQRDFWYQAWEATAVALVQQQQINVALMEEMGIIVASNKPTVH